MYHIGYATQYPDERGKHMIANRTPFSPENRTRVVRTPRDTSTLFGGWGIRL